ncbi:MAG TPA: amidohydrolase family protein, partial [Polyangia bacterium]
SLGARTAAVTLVLLAEPAACTRAQGRGDGAAAAHPAKATSGERGTPVPGAAPAASSARDAGVEVARPPAPSSSANAAPPDAGRPHPRFPAIDVHMHIVPGGIERTLALMDRWGLAGGVNLSGMYPGPPRNLLEMQLEEARATGGRLMVFANANFRRVVQDKDYGRKMAEDLVESRRLGAVGLKIPKGLGLGYPAPDREHLLPVDDPGLDPLFAKAGELGMPVAIHVGDPKAFWKPATPDNERWDELGAHPEWSFYGQPVPSWEELYAAFERRVARHPRTKFIAVHFGNDPEDPDRVARMLDKYPNFYIDTAARIPEIGRHDAARMRRFFEKYQDRILFGTDTAVGPTQEDMMYGSNGPLPPTLKDEDRFFRASWRYFETSDRQFESPTPIQGRWKIDGIGLPDRVLRKVYFENAARLLKWRPSVRAAGAPSPGGTAAP